MPISRCWPRRTGFAPPSATSPAPRASSTPSRSGSRPAPEPISTSRSRRACSPINVRLVPPLRQTLDQNINALATLVSRPPESVRITGGSLNQIAIPRVTPGLPSELLTQRPDIRRQEAQLASATANVGSARAQFFPSIQLTGQGGYQSSALSSLFQPHAAFFSLVGSADAADLRRRTEFWAISNSPRRDRTNCCRPIARRWCSRSPMSTTR